MKRKRSKTIVPRWFSWYNAAFLFGAACGGLVFGWLGDRSGRVRAMGASIFWFSLFSGVGYFSATPEQLLLSRFLAAMGVGGMWPTGVSLASEAWSEASRPMIAGMLGTSANVGLVTLNGLGYMYDVGPTSWRWTLLVCAAPIVLAFVVWFCVPESRRWLATRKPGAATGSVSMATGSVSMATVFRPPLLRLTLIGIALGTIPILGGWGATQWFIPWADKVGGVADPRAKALAGIMRSGGAVFGGLIGGWVANLSGRRLTYFLVSLSSLVLGEYIYLSLTPRDPSSGALCSSSALFRRFSLAGCRSICPSCFPRMPARPGRASRSILAASCRRSACWEPARSPHGSTRLRSRRQHHDARLRPRHDRDSVCAGYDEGEAEGLIFLSAVSRYRLFLFGVGLFLFGGGSGDLFCVGGNRRLLGREDFAVGEHF